MNKILMVSVLAIIMANGAYSTEQQDPMEGSKPTQQLSELEKMELAKQSDAELKKNLEKMVLQSKKMVLQSNKKLSNPESQESPSDVMAKLMMGLRKAGLYTAISTGNIDEFNSLIDCFKKLEILGKFFTLIAEALNSAQEEKMKAALLKAYNDSYMAVLGMSNMFDESIAIKFEVMECLAKNGDETKVKNILDKLKSFKESLAANLYRLEGVIEVVQDKPRFLKLFQDVLIDVHDTINNSLIEACKSGSEAATIENQLRQTCLSNDTILKALELLRQKDASYDRARWHMLYKVITTGTSEELKQALKFNRENLMSEEDIKTFELQRIFISGSKDERRAVLFKAVTGKDPDLLGKIRGWHYQGLDIKDLEEALNKANSEKQSNAEDPSMREIVQLLSYEIQCRLGKEERENAPEKVANLLQTGTSNDRLAALKIAAKFSEWCEMSKEDLSHISDFKAGLKWDSLLSKVSLIDLVIEADIKSQEKIPLLKIQKVLDDIPEGMVKQFVQKRIDQRAKELLLMVLEQEPAGSKSTRNRGSCLVGFVKANQTELVKKLLDNLQGETIDAKQFQEAMEASAGKPNILRLLVGVRTDENTVKVLGLLDKGSKDERYEALQIAANSSRDDLMRLVIEADIKSQEKIPLLKIQKVLDDIPEGMVKQFVQKRIDQRAKELLLMVLEQEPAGSKSTRNRGSCLVGFVKANQTELVKKLLDNLQGETIDAKQFQEAMEASAGKPNILRLLVGFQKTDEDKITSALPSIQEQKQQLEQQFAMQQQQMSKMLEDIKQQQELEVKSPVTESFQKVVTEEKNPILAAQQDLMSNIQNGRVKLRMQRPMPRTDQVLIDSFAKKQQNYIIPYVDPEVQQQKFKESFEMQQPKQVESLQSANVLGVEQSSQKKLDETDTIVIPQTEQSQNNQQLKLEDDNLPPQQLSDQLDSQINQQLQPQKPENLNQQFVKDNLPEVTQRDLKGIQGFGEKIKNWRSEKVEKIKNAFRKKKDD